VHNIDARAAAIRDGLRAPQLAAAPVVADAYGASTTALLRVIATLTDQIDTLESVLADRLSSTRTPTSCAACLDSRSSSAPGCAHLVGVLFPADLTRRQGVLRPPTRCR